jgi:hypothetical protein
MLAKNRLTQNGLVGVDISPNNPLNPDFRFGATDINEFGKVRMKWHSFPWSCPEGDIVLALEAYSRPSYTPASVLDTQLKYLEAIHHPGNAAKEAEDLAAKLKASQAPKNEPQWLYFLCAQDEADVLLEERDWAQMRKQPNDIKMMKRMSREQGKWPVIIRVSSVSLSLTHTHTHTLSLSLFLPSLNISLETGSSWLLTTKRRHQTALAAPPLQTLPPDPQTPGVPAAILPGRRRSGASRAGAAADLDRETTLRRQGHRSSSVCPGFRVGAWAETARRRGHGVWACGGGRCRRLGRPRRVGSGR